MRILVKGRGRGGVGGGRGVGGEKEKGGGRYEMGIRGDRSYTKIGKTKRILEKEKCNKGKKPVLGLRKC